MVVKRLYQNGLKIGIMILIPKPQMQPIFHQMRRILKPSDKNISNVGKGGTKSMSKHQKIRNHLIRVLKAKEKSVDKLTDRALLKAITNH